MQAKAYDQWKNAVLGSQPKLDPEFLLLPEHTGFTPDKEMCSTTGTALVRLSLSRTHTRTSPSI